MQIREVCTARLGGGARREARLCDKHDHTASLLTLHIATQYSQVVWRLGMASKGLKLLSSGLVGR